MRMRIMPHGFSPAILRKFLVSWSFPIYLKVISRTPQRAYLFRAQPGDSTPTG